MSGRSLVFAVLACSLPALASAFSAGPDADKVKTCSSSGACTQCHATTTTPSNASLELWIDGLQALPIPPAPANQSYTAGSTYDFVLKVVEANAAARCTHPPSALGCGNPVPANSCAFGFEMAAVTAASCAGTPSQAGNFIPTGAPATTQIKCGPGNGPPSLACMNPGLTTQYIEHVCASTVGTAAAHEWSFQWQAPAAGTGNVMFFFAVNSANANGRSTDDAIYFSADNPALRLILSEGTTSGTCDLRRASIASLTPPIAKDTVLFSDTTTCAGKNLPATVIVPDFGAAPDQDLADDIGSGDPLIVYQAEHSSCNGCSGKLYVVKNMITQKVHVSLQ